MGGYHSVAIIPSCVFTAAVNAMLLVVSFLTPSYGAVS
jgi:hypothetical protein